MYNIELFISFQREQAYSADQSSAVNKAYSTLFKPLSRGLYLVSTHFPLSYFTLVVKAMDICDKVEGNESHVKDFQF